MADAETMEVVRKVTKVTSAIIEGHGQDKQRNERLIMPTSWIQSESREIGASDVPSNYVTLRSHKSHQYFLKHKDA
ncbi:MAG TPA: hypothetical protein VKH62_13730 [Candidatus Binatia bacterium]|nr:hypothetical protein [Candidatus Binatia bacterium]